MLFQINYNSAPQNYRIPCQKPIKNPFQLLCCFRYFRYFPQKSSNKSKLRKHVCSLARFQNRIYKLWKFSLCLIAIVCFFFSQQLFPLVSLFLLCSVTFLNTHQFQPILLQFAPQVCAHSFRPLFVSFVITEQTMASTICSVIRRNKT